MIRSTFLYFLKLILPVSLLRYKPDTFNLSIQSTNRHASKAYLEMVERSYLKQSDEVYTYSVQIFHE